MDVATVQESGRDNIAPCRRDNNVEQHLCIRGYECIAEIGPDHRLRQSKFVSQALCRSKVDVDQANQLDPISQIGPRLDRFDPTS
jgi:hypothetical protein